MSPEMSRGPAFARCGNLDLRVQAEALNALRSEMPRRIRFEAFPTSALSPEAQIISA
jgi:hypothetical protein